MRGRVDKNPLLGSKERYREYFDAHLGTYWYSPGWIDGGSMPGKDRYEGALKHYIDKYGEDNGKYLMELEQGWFKNYTNAAYVDLGFYDTEKYKSYTNTTTMVRRKQWLEDIIMG